jgi:hypothetical protein
MLVPAAAIVAMLTGSAGAQMSPLMPKLSLQGDQKKMTPEELEKKRQLDDAYRAATAKIPDQKSSDPWADVRSAPVTPSAPAPKKKQQ